MDPRMRFARDSKSTTYEPSEFRGEDSQAADGSEACEGSMRLGRSTDRGRYVTDARESTVQGEVHNHCSSFCSFRSVDYSCTRMCFMRARICMGTCVQHTYCVSESCTGADGQSDG